MRRPTQVWRNHRDPVTAGHLPGWNGGRDPALGCSDKEDVTWRHLVMATSSAFERDIRPLFRTKDREAMLAAFDLFDYTDVVEHADAIVGSLSSGQMPCDGPWPTAQLDKLRRWIDMGKPA